MEVVIELKNLKKSFSKQKVLDEISLKQKSGEIIGFIGPSGAGKSTVIKIMLGMEKADSGFSSVLNTEMPNRDILGKIGYMAQSDALYENLTAYENLEFFGKMKSIPKKELNNMISYISEVVELTNDLDKIVSSFSGGMKRRLSLAIALLGNPKLLILDEPTVGIDPLLRKKIWKELIKLKNIGHSIFLTTHVMDEAELTDRVALLLNGKIIAFDTPENLKRDYKVKNIEEVFLKSEEDK